MRHAAAFVFVLVAAGVGFVGAGYAGAAAGCIIALGVVGLALREGDLG